MIFQANCCYRRISYKLARAITARVTAGGPGGPAWVVICQPRTSDNTAFDINLPYLRSSCNCRASRAVSTDCKMLGASRVPRPPLERARQPTGWGFQPYNPLAGLAACKTPIVAPIGILRFCMVEIQRPTICEALYAMRCHNGWTWDWRHLVSWTKHKVTPYPSPSVPIERVAILTRREIVSPERTSVTT